MTAHIAQPAHAGMLLFSIARTDGSVIRYEFAVAEQDELQALEAEEQTQGDDERRDADLRHEVADEQADDDADGEGDEQRDRPS